MSTRSTSKHRAAAPLPAPERDLVTDRNRAASHRGGRRGDLPIAALLGLIVLILAAYLAVRH